MKSSFVISWLVLILGIRCVNAQLQTTNEMIFREGFKEAEYSEEPVKFELSQNYPNPFNPITVISYSVPKPVGVKIVVYDILAREVAVLVYEYQQAGDYRVQFDGSRLTSGTYYYKIIAGEYKSVRKMTLVK